MKENEEKKIECREQAKLVEKLRPDRPGKNLGPEIKKLFDPVTPGRARPVPMALVPKGFLSTNGYLLKGRLQDGPLEMALAKGFFKGSASDLL